MCNVKYGSVRAKWTTVIVTSNKPPSQWYPNMDKRHTDALIRRFEDGDIKKFVDSTKIHNHEAEKLISDYPKEHEDVLVVDRAEINRLRRENAAREDERFVDM